MLELEAEGVTVSVDAERGGRLASLRVGGRELLVGPPDPGDTSIRWGCFLMAPWAGRLAGASFEWLGRTTRLHRTHGPNAIHGLVWDRPWAVDGAADGRVSLSCPLPHDEWPMGGMVRQRYVLAPGSLRLEAEIEAVEPMPAAIGWHPWFRRDGDVRLGLSADGVLETSRLIPTGRVLPISGRLDLGSAPVLGRRRLDHAYVGARSPVEIAWPDLALTMSFDPVASVVVVYTPPQAFCVEPQTAWPNALHGAIAHLRGGERLRASMVLAWPTPQ